MTFIDLSNSFFRAKCFVFIILLFCFCKLTTAVNTDSLYYKLPSTILPTKYSLHISTLIHQNILPFNGSVSIYITIIEPTNKIVLNAYQLRDFNITLTNIESGLILKSPFQLQHELVEIKQQLRIYWPEYPFVMKIGQQYRLDIDYVGSILEGEIFGFYKSHYLNDDEKPVQLAVTQFEPSSARLAFPCFDDPALKAKFTISITHGTNYSAISNMPADGESILSSTANGDMLTTKFLETPPMSTYLVAFAVTNFKNSSIKANGLELRFFYPPNSKCNSSLVLDNANKIVGSLEKLLGIKYSLPKLDLIPIRRLYGVAMENWGLMTFQDSEILSNINNNSKFDEFSKIRTQSHEIAHQWFGNLVTPASWNYVWLKEGFSTYFSYVAIDLVYPDDKIMEMFLVSEVPTIYSTSDLNDTLTKVVKEGTDPKDSYNDISYQFGAVFLRMFHHAIGHDTFMKGVFKYLYLNQYSVANDHDFFAAMQSAVDEDKVELFQNNQSVTKVMQSWTQNKGFPIVSVIRNYENGTVTIRQKSRIQNETQYWWIPLSFASASAPGFDRTLADYIMPPQAEVTIDLKDLNISLSNSDWLIVNKQQTGLFFVVYDDVNLKLISEALSLDPNVIHKFSRAQILRDITETFDLYSIESIMELLEYLKNEKESMPWSNAVDLIMKILINLDERKVAAQFRNFIYDLLIAFYDQKFKTSISEDQFPAVDFRLTYKIKILKYEVDTVTCRNYTTEQAIDYINRTNDTEMPCKKSFCQAFKNLTFDEFVTVIKESTSSTVGLETLKAYEYLSVLKCVELKEIFKKLYDNLTADKNSHYFEVFDSILVSNPFFETWFSNYYNNEKKDKSEDDIVFKYRSNKIMQRKKFLEKYESNISAWLENYEMKNQLNKKPE